MARSETFPDLTATTDRLDGSDFNDLENAHGPAAVVESINAAVHGSNATPDTDPATAEDWPEPVPLPDALPPVMPFDVGLLPEALRGWVADIAHRMQCPPDFTAVGAVTALSSLIGARAVVNPKTRDDWAVVPNMWGLIVGRPGVMKSPALGEALKTLHRMEANELQAHDAAMQEWDLDNRVEALASEAREKEAKKLAAKDPAAARELLRAAHTAPKPVERRYITNDSTACWGEGVADPLEDLAEWSRLVSQKSGATANNVVMDLKAWQLFSAAPSVKELLDRQRGTATANPAVAGEGGRHMATIGDLNIWLYHSWFNDPDTDEKVPYLPDYTVILTGPELEGTRCYGAIKDAAAGFQAVPFFAKTWNDEDPAVRYMLMQSAPLIVPYRVNASMCVTVR